MVRGFALVVFLVGCAADPAAPIHVITEVNPIVAGNAEVSQTADVCDLAAALPADDPCSQVCDPSALREAMIAAGYAGGRCYLLECALTDDVCVGAGACLP